MSRSSPTVRPAATGAGPRSLAEDLRARSDDELAEVLRARPDLLTPVPTDITRLAERAATRASVSRALDRLDRFALQVLDGLAVLPEPVHPDDLASLLGAEPAAVTATVAQLRRLALVWGGAEEVRLVRTVADLLGPSPAGLGPPVVTALTGQPPARVAELAATLGGRPTGDPVADAEQVAAVLSAGERVDALVAETGPEAAEVLETLTWGPPAGRVADAGRTVSVRDARTPVEALLARGLLIPVGPDTVVLPREVALHLRGGRLHRALEASPPDPEGPRRDPAVVDRAAAGSAAEAVRRVEALLEAWAEAPPTTLRAGGIGVRELRRAAGIVDLDEAGAALLCEIAYAAGLVAPDGELDEVWLPTPAYDGWRRLDVAHRWAQLAATWLATSRTPALVGARDDRDRPVSALGPDADRPATPQVRRWVLEVLRDAGAGQAVTAESLAAALAWRRPRRSGPLRDLLVDATLAEAAGLGVTALGALSAPGAALLEAPTAVLPGDAAAAPALVAAATALAALLPPPLNHVLLQADLTAVAPGPLEPDLGRELGLVADVESTGGATVYRFTPDSVRRALDAGRTAAELLELLERASRTPVPQPLRYLVEDVARRHGLLRVGAAASFVRGEDPAVLAEIAADSRTAALGLRRIAPTVLAAQVPPETLLARLRALGHAPAAEAADGSVIVARRADRRAPARPAPRPLLAERPVPAPTLLSAAVRALRAGDRSVEYRPAGAVPGRLGRTASAEALAALRQAVDSGSSVWIGYVDRDGVVSERVVDPVRVEGGWLTAYDHRSDQVRTFAVHRLSGVAPVDA